MDNGFLSRILRPRIFLQLMLFYWVLLLAGLVPNPFSEGQGLSFALYTLLAILFSMVDALINNPRADQSEPTSSR